MCHVMYIVVCFIILDVFKTISNENMNHKVLDTLSINDMTNALVNALGVNIEGTTDERIKELKEKLDKINSFAINKAKYEILLKNITAQTSLNETNFYKSLNEDDQFKFLSTKESKNLYLKLKERMNRDDIMKILAEKAEDGNVMRSARKVMTRGRNKLSRSSTDEELDVVVDEMLGEIPNDNHKYDSRDNQSVYWDPQIELEELRDYHRQGGRRLYRGERTTIRYYPFMVSIHVLDRFWCGGVIYWYDLVLTSAACLQLMHNNRFFRENPRVLQVRVGSNHSRISGEVVDALEVYFHPGYNPRTLRNNIAVIRLRRHLYLNYHRIPKLVAISHDANSIAATGEVLLLGWGVTKISQKLSYEPIYLQRKFLPVYPNTFCKEIYGDKFISESMFCAGTFTTGEGACDHDAGGPALLGGKLVGIISFGPAVCGYPNTPTVFTLVGAFADWIETINETMPEYYRGKARTTVSTRRPLLQFLQTLYEAPSREPTRETISPFQTVGPPSPRTEPNTQGTDATTLRRAADSDDDFESD